MKISTKARYGLRALVDLAVHSGGEPLALIYIAKRQKLSVNYLEQVFSLLKKSNILKSVKGAQGGYMLAKKPSDITVGDILRAIEGDIELVEKEAPNDNASLILKNLQECIWQNVWQKMTQSVCDVIDAITLEELMKDYQVLNSEEGWIYHI